jgi:hypothetical protein
MFPAGETATAGCSVVAAAAATAADISGAVALLWFAIVWNVVSTIVTTVRPKATTRRLSERYATPPAETHSHYELNFTKRSKCQPNNTC